MSIEWKDGRHSRIPAEAAYNELNRIKEKYGSLEARYVPEESRSANALLHSVFEWDDRVAGIKHREEQARKLIQSLIVVHEEAPEVKVRAFQIVSAHRRSEETKRAVRVYESTGTALEDPSMRQEILDRAMRELNEFRKRYSALTELAEVLSAIDRLAA